MRIQQLEEIELNKVLLTYTRTKRMFSKDSNGIEYETGHETIHVTEFKWETYVYSVTKW
jgi:hypothetical protein